MSNGPRNPVLPLVLERETYRRPKGFLAREWQEANLGKFLKAVDLANGRFFSYTLYAGTGAGKTDAAALMAMEALRRGHVERVLVVVPNRNILRAVRRIFAQYGIHLAWWKNKSHRAKGEGIGDRGAVMTYPSLINSADAQREFCQDRRTLVILDEIHHLGQSQEWADKAEYAFLDVAWGVVCMTGTPYRSDDKRIPFAVYEDVGGGLRKLKPDFPQTLGKCIVEGFCRKPLFRLSSPTIEIRRNGVIVTRTFKEDNLSEDVADLILSESVRRGSKARRVLTREAVAHCRGTGERPPKKMIVFVDRKDDATTWLPMELTRFGVGSDEVCSITSDDSEAQEKLDEFGKSSAWILITVDMVSEGVNIPELEVALFLSQVTARPKTAQRIGRALRGTGHAWIFMFADPRYVTICLDIEAEYRHELELREAPPPIPRPSNGGGPAPDEPKAVETYACMDGMIESGILSDESLFQAARVFCRSNGLDVARSIATVVSLLRLGKLRSDGEDDQP